MLRRKIMETNNLKNNGHRLMEIAFNAVRELEYSEYEHERILELLDINETEYKTIKEFGREEL